jgi:hypothetical protein
MSTEDKRLLDKLALALHGKNSRIKDLEAEVGKLKEKLKSLTEEQVKEKLT